MASLPAGRQAIVEMALRPDVYRDFGMLFKLYLKIFMKPSLLLLSTFVATLRSASCSIFSNKGRCFLLIILSYLLTQPTFSQTKQTEHVQQTWLGFFNQTRFSNKWGAWADVHLRTKEDLVNDLSQSIVRVGLTYYLNDDTKLTAGYAYVSHYPADNHKNVTMPEHRPWQQVQWHSKYSRLRLMQWFRLEERFRKKILNDDELADGYNFNFRLRYNILFMVPLSKKRFEPKTLSFVVNDEVHIN